MLEFAFYTERRQLVDLLNVLLVLINGYSDITLEEEIEYIVKLNNFIYGDKSLIKNNDTKYQPNQDLNKKLIPNIGYKYRLRSRYEENREENILLMDSKEIICQIFNTIF